MLDAFGHVSVRSDRDREHYPVVALLAPELVTAADLIEYDLDSNAGRRRRGASLFLERFIHGEIYRARPDVMAVVHSHSPSVIPFAVSRCALRPIYHMGAFLGARRAGVRHPQGVRRRPICWCASPTLGAALADDARRTARSR